MRTIGIDLAISGKHHATILDDQQRQIGPHVIFDTCSQDFDALLRQARRDAPADEPLQIVMEPTGSIWLPFANYFTQRQVTVYLVNAQYAARLQKADRPRGRSDRTSADMLAKLPSFNRRVLHPLQLDEASRRAGQRFARQYERLTKHITAQKNRIQAIERTHWPGLGQVVKQPLAPWMRRWREELYDPQALLSMTETDLINELMALGAPPDALGTLALGMRQVAQEVLRLYGPAWAAKTFPDLRVEVLVEQDLLALYETERKQLGKRIRELQRQLDPENLARSVVGVGEQGAAVYTFFIGDGQRFPSQRQFRGWTGMCPRSSQSGDVEAKGMSISKAGPSIIKQYAYLNAEIARQRDPQIAAIYYGQMVNRGKHHTQAVCCCATHLLDRIRAVLRSGKPYELRDVDGRPITKQEGRAIVLERYQVPAEVRRRRTRRQRSQPTSPEPRRSRSRKQEASLMAASA
jgi:transposase